MVVSRSHGSTELPLPIRRAAYLYGALWTICLLAEAISRFKHYGFPYVWPLMPYYDAFTDFLFFKPHAATFHTMVFFDTPIVYPAPIASLLKCWYLLPWPLAGFLCFTIASFVLAGLLFARTLRREGVSRSGMLIHVSVFATSFPLWFELEQGNTEAAVWLVVALGIWAFLRGRPYAAAVCIGFAGSMKIFPFVFLGLFLARRQYRPTIVACGTGLILFAVSLWLESGSVMGSWHSLAGASNFFRTDYILKTDSSGFDHSLFALCKQLVAGHRRDPGLAQPFAVMLRWYMAVVSLTGIFLFFTRIQKMPLLNQILALTVASILLPPVSFDYTLIHLDVPCALLILTVIQASKRGAIPVGAGAALIAFAVLLAPETEIIAQRVSLGGDIKCVTLFVLFVLALCYRFEAMSEPLRTA